MKQYYLSILTTLAIVMLSLIPGQEFPEVDVPFADKWTHWVMYGFLTLVYFWDSRKGMCSFVCRLFVICIASVSLGGAMELAQAYLTTTRTGDWWDFVANSFGVLCATIGVLLYRLFRSK